MTLRLATVNVLLLAAAVSLPAGSAQAKKRETVVYSFGTVQNDGLNPQDGLVADSAGNLYGTTIDGGAFGDGTIFVIRPGGAENVLYSFSGAPGDGAEPNAALTIDKHGVLYGTTLIGGSANKGVAFQFNPTGLAFTVIYSFCSQTSCADGNSPAGAVTIGAKGVLYGTTQLGGLGAAQQNSGVAYRLHPPTRKNPAWTETVLYNFCSQSFCADGKTPYDKLLLSNGVLYGTASQGQQGGTLFALSPAGGGFQLLHVFATSGGDGVSPKSGVIADSNGVFYGTTSQGGADSCGTVYSYNPSTAQYQTVYSFCSQTNDPSLTYGGLALVQNKSGLALYGASIQGGTHSHGTLYELTAPLDSGPWQEKVLYSFCALTNCSDGGSPAFGTPVVIKGVVFGTTSGGGNGTGGGVVYRYGK